MPFWHSYHPLFEYMIFTSSIFRIIFSWWCSRKIALWSTAGRPRIHPRCHRSFIGFLKKPFTFFQCGWYTLQNLEINMKMKSVCMIFQKKIFTLKVWGFFPCGGQLILPQIQSWPSKTPKMAKNSIFPPFFCIDFCCGFQGHFKTPRHLQHSSGELVVGQSVHTQCPS